MRRLLRKFRVVATMLALLMLTTSCGVSKLVKSHDKILFEGITAIHMKGMTGVAVTCQVRNDSKHDLGVKGSEATLMLDGKIIAILVQMENAVAYANRVNQMESMWRIEKIDPMNTILLAARIAKMDLRGLTLDVALTLTADNSNLRLSRKSINLEKIAKKYIQPQR